MAVAYTLQVDDVSIANGDEKTGYRLHEARFPAPKERGDLAAAKEVGGQIDEADAHNPAERVLIFSALGADERAAAAAVNAVVVAASRRGAKLRFRASATSELLECEIRRVEVAEDSFEPLTRQRGRIKVTLVLVTSPYWIGEEITAIDAVATSNLPAYVDVNDVRGEVPALTRVTATFAQAVTAIFIGMRSAPSAAVLAALALLVQDYSGTANANTNGGVAQSANLTTTPATIGSPPTVDVSVFRGLYLVVARLLHTAAAAASTLYNAVSSVSASNMIGTASEPTDQVPATVTGANFEASALGLVAIPAGAVPDDDESGYADESTSLNNAAGATLIDVETGVFRVQTEPTCRHTGALWKIKNTSGSTQTVRALLYRASGGVPVGSILASDDVDVADGHDATVRFSWAADIVSDSYATVVQPASGVAVAGLKVYGATGGGTNYGGQKLSGSWVSGSYGAETVTILQDTYNTTSSGTYNATQTFVASGVVQKVSAWFGTSGAGSGWLRLFPPGANTANQYEAVATQFISGASPVAKQTLDVAEDASSQVDYSGQTLTIKIEESVGFLAQRNTANVYANGACSAGGDLRFEVTERLKQNVNFYVQTFVELPLGFTASVGVQAECSESTKTASLDNVALIPIDEGAVVVKYTAATTAGDGIMIDNLPARRGSRNVYAASAAGGRGLSLIGKSTLYGAVMLKPRSNRIVIAAYTPSNAAPTTATVTIKYRPRYLNAASGK